MNLLADVLAVSGVRGTLGARIEASGPWGVRRPENANAVFYALIAGTAWLELPTEPARQLIPGDVVLLPTGTAHTLSHEPATADRAYDFSAAQAFADEGGILRFGTGEVHTSILGASYEHDRAVSAQLLSLLPQVVHIRCKKDGCRLDETVQFLARELASPQIASDVVLDRLVDILLVQLLRAWLDSGRGDSLPSWSSSLRDPLVTEALTKLHHEPARPWTAETLAAELAVSRATLSRRFLTVVGQTPAAYLTQWRMDLAARRLRDTDDTLDTIAHSVGYASVYAFSRAFSRARSAPPGRYRALSQNKRVHS